MSVLKTLRDKVAPELNHLFHGSPGQTVDALQAGWRAREHALHAFFVARMFGSTAELCRGDIAVLSRFLPPISTLDRAADHAWCNVGGVVPVDLSLTFELLENVPQLRAPITGDGVNGAWQVRYAHDEALLDEGFPNDNEILFIERAVQIEPESLLRDPAAFLAADPVGENGTELERYGADIHAKITLHCFRLATGDAKSVRQRFKR